MKIIHFSFLIFLIFLGGCKNPLDESGTGKSIIDDAYNAFLRLPSSFSFTTYDMQSSQVTLRWEASERADSYQVKYGTNSGVHVTSTSCTSSPCTITGLTNGTTYYFTALAINPKGSTSVTSELSITPINAPSIPTGVGAVSANASVALTWSASTGNGTIKYKVLRSTTSGSGYSQIATDLAVTTYSDTSVANNTTYYYVVRSFNEFGEGTNSSEVVGTPMSAPSAPTGLSATSALSQVNLSWSAAAGSGAKTYTVYRSTTSGSGHAQLATNISALIYTDATASVGTTYYYYVTATNLGGTSPASSEVSGRAYQNFSLNIPFTGATEANYSFSNSSVSDFSGGVLRLTPSDQTDDDSSSSGFGGATFTGTQYDSTNGYLRLNTTTNTAEFDASWTPQWGNLTGHWKLNGTGNISSGANVLASVGSNGIEADFGGGTLAAYSTALLNQGVYFSSSNTRLINIGTGPEYDYGMTSFTVSYWIKFDTGSTNPQWSAGKGAAYNGCGGAPTGAGTGGWGIAHWTTSDPIVPQLFLSDGTTCFGFGNNGMPRGKWGHIVVRVNRSNNIAALFVNGVQSTYSISSLGSISNIAGGFQYLSIGRGAGAPAQGLVMDEFAVWNSVLTDAQIQTIYQRQSAKYSGLAQSRVMDAQTSQPWTNLQSLTTLPFYKEMAPSQESTSSTSGYSNLSSSLNSGLVSLWHMDETSGTVIADSSGTGNHGTFLNNGGTALGASGVLNQSVSSTGPIPFRVISPANLPTTAVTVSVWYFPTSNINWNNLINNNWTSSDGSWLLFTNSSGDVYFGIYDVSLQRHSIKLSSLQLNSWNHLVGTYDGSNIRIYVNGSIGSVQPLANKTLTANSNLIFGNYNGSIDEAGIWNRALTNSEITQLYRRGANRLKYQIRSCASSDCSDQEALTSSYKGWKGPDNTGLTYFSELFNTASNSPTGVIQTGNPVMTFSNFSGIGLSVPNNRYFQYRTILESDDLNNLCNYGSGSTACSPELKSVTIGPNHYSTTNVYVTSYSAIGSLFQTLNGFTSTLGSNSCTGDRYSISGDGTNFWYYNGSSWALSNGSYAQSSTGTQINTNIGSLVAAMGVGTLQVRTYLNSDGVTPCEVDNILIQGQKY